MELISQIKTAVTRVLTDHYDFRDGVVLVNETKPEFEGDYTVVLFSFIKQLKKSPEVLATSWANACCRRTPPCSPPLM